MKTATMSRQEEAEVLLIQLDSVQDELETAATGELFESCKVQVAALKAELEALGYQVQRAVRGWRLSATQEVVEETQAEPMLHSDEQGLYASVPSSNGKTTYRVGVCAMWLKTIGCTCASGDFGKDCRHQVQIDAQLRDIRPTFSEWIAGKGASHEVIASLVATPDRYREPLKGSGVTGFRAAEVERKLAA